MMEEEADPMAAVQAADDEERAALKGSLASDIPKPEGPLSKERVRRLVGALEEVKEKLGGGELPPTEFELLDEDYGEIPEEIWMELVALRGAIDAMNANGLDVAAYDDFDPTAAASSDAGLRAAEMTLREMASDPDLLANVEMVPDTESQAVPEDVEAPPESAPMEEDMEGLL